VLVKSRAVWALLGVVVIAAIAVLALRSDVDNSPEARAGRLERQLACPVCSGESVAASNAPESRAMRDDIRERIGAGESDREIRDAYVRTYGERVLLTPDSRGLAVVAWGLPVAALVVGAAVIVFTLRRWSRTSEVALVGAGPDAAPGDAPATTPGASRAMRALTIAGIGVFAVVAAVALAAAVGQRRSGQTITGNAQVSDAPAADDVGATLAAAAEREPQDYGARVAYARYLLREGDVRGAIEEFDAAAAIDRAQPEPLAYGGWIRGLAAQQVTDPDDRALLVDGAVERLDQAIAADAEYADAYVFKGLVLLNVANDPAGAVPAFQEFLVLAPQDHPMRQQVLEVLERAANSATTSSTPRP
jgi:cytochrome c-type biogenesis protein CcmH